MSLPLCRTAASKALASTFWSEEFVSLARTRTVVPDAAMTRDGTASRTAIWNALFISTSRRQELLYDSSGLWPPRPGIVRRTLAISCEGRTTSPTLTMVLADDGASLRIQPPFVSCIALFGSAARV
jgi:hypothetical protein